MKEKKGRLYKFYGKLTIRNKLLISCLPFVILGYFLIFYSTTVIMLDQMKQMVYDQTEQNVMEKKKLVNTLLDNYNQATIKFLYYTDEVQELIRSEIPVVTIDHVFDGNIAVVSNNSQGMEELVSYIYEQGHRKIAYIHGDNTSVTRMRLTSFYRTVQRLGVQIPDEYVKESPYRDADSAARTTSELLELPDPPTCIIYPDDYAAIGGINEIRERGLRIPDDISIAGYDGIDIAKILEPKLTTLCQDTAAIGRMAAEKLIDLIENPKTTLIDRFSVDGTLFKGASVKKIRGLKKQDPASHKL